MGYLMLVAKIIENTDSQTLNKFVHQTVSEDVSLMATDEHSGYRHLKKNGYPHETLCHGKGEYVRGLVHTSNWIAFGFCLGVGLSEPSISSTKSTLRFT